METTADPGPEKLAGLGKRAGAFLIDSVVLGFGTALVLVVPMVFLLGVSDPSSGVFSSGGFLVAFALLQFVSLFLFYGYHIALEAIYGYTVGKRLLDIRVVGENGSEIGWFEATVRNLLLIVDNLPFAYLLGIGLILHDDDEQRLGDMAADTYVVDT